MVRVSPKRTLLLLQLRRLGIDVPPNLSASQLRYLCRYLAEMMETQIKEMK